MSKQVIIFDFDGVLRSVSWEGLMLAYVAIIARHGKVSTDFFTNVDEFKNWFDSDWHKNAAKIGGMPIDNAETNALFHRVYDPHVSLFPWVEDLLIYLSPVYHLAILSSSSVYSVKKDLGVLAKYFSVIVGAETVTKLKPDPEGVHHILNHFGVPNTDAIIIGDTPHDFYAGKNAIISTCLVRWGLTDWEELKSLEADFYLDEFIELFDF